METQIQIKISNEEKELIKLVAKDLSIGYSTFCRQVSLREAKEHIKKNNLEVS